MKRKHILIISLAVVIVAIMALVPFFIWNNNSNNNDTANNKTSVSNEKGSKETMALKNNVMINQVYGRGENASDSNPISHSFIELYNPTDKDIDLSSYSVQVSEFTGGGVKDWQKLDLIGKSIGARQSFLIRCSSANTACTYFMIEDEAYDIDWDVVINNKGFNVAIINNQELLPTDLSAVKGLMTGSPSTIIDLVGAYNNDNQLANGIDLWEGSGPNSDISRYKSVRRIGFYDSDDNAVDFESLDFRNITDINDPELEITRPHWSGDGAWGLDIVVIAPSERLKFSHTAGLYPDEFDLTLSTGFENGIIRYTLDGTDPTVDSTVYARSLLIWDRTSEPNVLPAIAGEASGHTDFVPTANVFKGTVIKAQVYSQEGKPLTKVFTNSYFVGTKYNDLPVISLSINQSDLFAPGENGGIFNKDNVWRRNYEKTVYFELFEPGTTEPAVSRTMGIRIQGGVSRNAAQKSIRLYARPMLDYDLFQGNAIRADGTEITAFNTFILRQAANDNEFAFMRDALIQDLAKKLYPAYQAYRQSVVFINGEFWGIYNIRERYDDHLFSEKYDIEDRNKIETITNGSNTAGREALKYCPEECREAREDGVIAEDAHLDSCVKFKEMWVWFNKTASLASADDYAKAQTFIDVDSFIDHYIVGTFGDNRDWPGNNVYTWRYGTKEYPATAEGLSATTYEDGRWRFALRDLDWIFNLYSSFEPLQEPTFNSFERLITSEPDFQNWESSNVMFRRLITNEEFLVKFINRYCDILNIHFETGRILNKIEEMEIGFTGEPISQQRDRWIAWGGYNTVESWHEQLEQMRAYVQYRGASVFSHLRLSFGGMQSVSDLQNEYTLTIETDTNKGYAVINSIVLDDDLVVDPALWKGTYYGGMKQIVSAVPLDGYTIVKYVVDGVDYSSDTVEIIMEKDTVVQVVFK